MPLAAARLALLRLRALAGARPRDSPTAASRTGGYPVQRAAFVIVFMVAVHSMLEYPLWYSYFLLPTAFAFGLCLERPVAGEAGALARDDGLGNVTRPYVIAAMLLILGGTLAVYDYMRVVVIFAPPAGAGVARAAHRRRPARASSSATMPTTPRRPSPSTPAQVMNAFKRAPHYLLDARLMMAWAKALDEHGETDKARYLAARLKEFRNDQAEEFFAPCRAELRGGAARQRRRRPAVPVPGADASACASRTSAAEPASCALDARG